jgi:hypothetical protein
MFLGAFVRADCASPSHRRGATVRRSDKTRRQCDDQQQRKRESCDVGSQGALTEHASRAAGGPAADDLAQI